MTKDQEKHYRLAVMRAHNIEIEDNGFICNDGDVFSNLWEALDHTIWLDMMSTRILGKDRKERDCRDYYEIMNERESHQSVEEDK